MPLFLIASAAEARAPPPDVAAWRSVMGNLLAGALAGTAVEGGEAQTASPCSACPQRACAAAQ